MKKEWTNSKDTTDKEVSIVLAYIAGDSNLAQLIKKTGTTTSGCYSLIARATRKAFALGKITINS